MVTGNFFGDFFTYVGLKSIYNNCHTDKFRDLLKEMGKTDFEIDKIIYDIGQELVVYDKCYKRLTKIEK